MSIRPPDFVNDLPMWSADPSMQIAIVEQMKTMLNELQNTILANINRTITLFQASQPTQGEWQTAWTGAGYSLPISPSATLIWFNTTSSRIGGTYGTLTGGDGTVYNRGSRFAPGSVVYMDTAARGDSVASTNAIGVGNSNHPSLSFLLPVRANLRLEYILSVNLNSGSGSWGADFLLNSQKVGTVYFNIASNAGLSARSTAGVVHAVAELTDVQPGNYTIQALFGNTGGSVAVLGIGGTYGIRLLTARAYAR